MESKTPRTDANVSWVNDDFEVVPACFSRKFEFELAEARAEIERLKAGQASDAEKLATIYGKKCRVCGGNLNTTSDSRCSGCLEIMRIRIRDKWNGKKAYSKIKERMSADQQYKMSKILRDRLNKAIKGVYKAGSAISDLGCSAKFLIGYLTALFSDGMTWGNHGKKDDSWQIDHIRPLSSFDLSQPAQLKAACHYSNLQPLWRNENIKKGGKYVE